MSNALLVLDILEAILIIQQRAGAILRVAQIEGRDVTQDELDALHQSNEDLRAEWDAMGAITEQVELPSDLSGEQ